MSILDKNIMKGSLFSADNPICSFIHVLDNEKIVKYNKQNLKISFLFYGLKFKSQTFLVSMFNQIYQIFGH